MTDETETKDEKASTPVEQLFFKSRTVIVTGAINDKLASRTVTHLLALAEESDDPINMFISSPGGHVESGDMVHDMIKFIRPTVRTIGSGWVASAGALIFVGGCARKPFLPAEYPLLAAPTQRRHRRLGLRYPDPGRANPPDERTFPQTLRRGHGPDTRKDCPGHQARFLAEHR